MSHALRAAEFLRDAERARWHDGSLWSLREKRDRAAAAVPDWESLREAAAALKRHVLAELPFYLTRFEERAQAHRAVVHWARDAAEHNQIVEGLLREAGARRVVKSKSMLTEECGLNPHLEARGQGQCGRVAFAFRSAELRVEERADLLAPQVDGRHHDVARPLVAELHDALAEIGVDDLDAARLEVRIEPALLRQHRLALDHAARATTCARASSARRRGSPA